MEEKTRKIKRIAVLFSVVVLIFGFSSTFINSFFSPQEIEFGATFSDRYATELGLDWQEAYIAVLDDLNLSKIRIPIYWSDVEKEIGEKNYENIDWMMDRAGERNIDVTLIIGMKVPRWPECFVPDCVECTSQIQIDKKLADFMQETILRYRNHPGLERWQIENEVFFPFGVCTSPDVTRVYNELELVKNLDSRHKIQMTSSGEQSFWAVTAHYVDVFGFSIYRWTWNPILGFIRIPMPEFGYALQNKIASMFTEKVIVSELQAEPWFSADLNKTDVSNIQKYYSLFTAQELFFQTEVARRTGVSEVYFWGVEWWYYLDQNGENRLWETGKNLINKP